MCPLVDFDGRSSHSNAPKSISKLRLNRTEVVRRKANLVLPIFALKSRYNRANYSLDGEDGPAVDVASGGYDDFDGPNAHVTSATEDVDFDLLIHDYVIPKAKTIDALRKPFSSR